MLLVVLMRSGVLTRKGSMLCDHNAGLEGLWHSALRCGCVICGLLL